jgi:hypothetical protein
MAKSNFVERAEITEIYFPEGSYYQDQRPKFIKAPFDFVKIGSEEYIQPEPMMGSAEFSGILNANVIPTEYRGRRDFGYVNLTPVVSNENEWGGFQKEGVRGLHYFDLI